MRPILPLLALGLVACGAATAGPQDTARTRNGVEPRVVVAVIDTGINPYHTFFRRGSALYPKHGPSSVTADVLREFGVGPRQQLRLKDYASDAELWASLQPGQVYWFKGTNILAVSFNEDEGNIPILPDGERDTHGVSTSAAVLKANPEAIVLFIEATTTNAEFLDGDGAIYPDAEAFAFGHPAVDIVSTSYGMPGSLPQSGGLADSYFGVVEGGKLHFGAADNSPAAAPVDATAGPWWSIGIAGFEEGSSNGRQLLSGTAPDFVADFSQELPGCASCEVETLGMHYGTSFATPRAAGVASRVLLEARRNLGHGGGIRIDGERAVMAQGANNSVSNWQLRRALEEAAYVPGMGQYDAVEGVFDQVAIPTLDPAPWLTVAWGVLSADETMGVVPQTLAHLGLGGTPAANKDPGFCQWQGALMQERNLYWSAVSGHSADGHYIACQR